MSAISPFRAELETAVEESPLVHEGPFADEWAAAGEAAWQEALGE